MKSLNFLASTGLLLISAAFAGDKDYDGISDSDEVKVTLTNKHKADTDGDKVFDNIEIESLFTDPNSPDIEIKYVDALTSADATVLNGTFEAQGDAMVSTGEHGTLRYTFEVPEVNRYLVKFKINRLENQYKFKNNHFLIYNEGKLLRRATLKFKEGKSLYLQVLTPFLSAGQNSIDLEWGLFWRNRQISVEKVYIHKVSSGGDVDGSHMSQVLYDQYESGHALTTTQTSSLVSPVCIEGLSDKASAVKVDNGSVKRATANKWYKNLYLNPNGSKSYTVEFHNGLKTEAKQITWQPTVLSEHISLDIRVNDSLLLSGFPNEVTEGSAIITVNGEELDQISPNGVKYKFSSTGTYEISSLYTNGDTEHSSSLTVNVVKVWTPSYLGYVDTYGSKREWLTRTYTNYHFGSAIVHLEADQLKISKNNLSGTEYEVTYDWTDVQADEVITIRLGENGPTAKTIEMELARGELSSIAQGFMNIVEVYEDGSRLHSEYFYLNKFVDGGKYYLNFWTPGMFLETGESKKTFTESDFTNGRIFYRAYKYPYLERKKNQKTSTCHRLDAQVSYKITERW